MPRHAMPDPVHDFHHLQDRLGPIYELSTVDSTTPHAVVVMPSYSVDEGLLAHYGDRLIPLEHRFLAAILLLRIPTARLLYLCSVEPAPEVLDHLFALLPDHPDARDRFHLIAAGDEGPARPVAAKLLERPDLQHEILEWIGELPAYIEPWNVAEPEQALALQLGLPIMGSELSLWPLGFKSSGRRLFAEAGVPAPPGVEDLTTPEEAVAAIEQLRAADPALPAVILKHDNSGAGDGNAVIHTDGLEPPGSVMARRQLLSRINQLEPWYLDTLELGFVVESRIVGERFASPSAQVEIRPDRSVVVLSTHEQVLGGDDGQIYLGCRFPAHPDYGAQLGTHAETIAMLLGSKGALGRVGIDFVTARTGDEPWTVHPIEINLRKPGTTHPYAVLRHLAPGRYDVAAGEYRDDRGVAKYYVASDNLVDEHWTGLPEPAVIDAIGRAGLSFDHETRTGVVPHMLSCLAIDGRFGFTAVANSPAEADRLEEALVAGMQELAWRG